MPYYAGIGSRKTPKEILDLMTHIAKHMRSFGWVLRSGAAEGADTAFENGAGDLKEIFTARSNIPKEAMDTVDKYHPAPSRLSPYVRKLMARNAMQIFGSDMDTPVGLVVCWTPDGANGTTIPTTQRTGGTGQAIRIAAANGIQVLNLANQDVLDRVIAKTKYSA